MNGYKFFNIILVDLLSQSDKTIISEETDYLDALKSICEVPHFNEADSVTALKKSTIDFINWLEQEVAVSTWFPSLNINPVLYIKRELIVEMRGNISKHNFLRSGRIGNKLIHILKKSSVSVTFDEALLALSDFYVRFSADILQYHASTIAEFLNNIRWGIYEYLQPEFQRSIIRKSGDPTNYRYTYPASVTTNFAKECYWELMNEVRNQPYVRRFQVSRFLKALY